MGNCMRKPHQLASPSHHPHHPHFQSVSHFTPPLMSPCEDYHSGSKRKARLSSKSPVSGAIRQKASFQKEASTRGSDEVSGKMLQIIAGASLEDLTAIFTYQQIRVKAKQAGEVLGRPRRCLDLMALQNSNKKRKDNNGEDVGLSRTTRTTKILQPTDHSDTEAHFLADEEFAALVRQVEFICEDPQAKYDFTRKIGRGGNCKVYLAKDQQEPHKSYAVRYIHCPDPAQAHRIKAEIASMQLCKSRRVLQHHFTYLHRNYVYMFVEHMEGGSLYDLIQRNRQCFQEPLVAYILREVLKGLAKVHELHQIHRDIKSENILLGRNGEVKIGDFGAVSQLTKENKFSRGFEGTVLWMAPEVIHKAKYTEKIDIWSLGILAHELIHGSPPHQKLHYHEALASIANGAPPTVDGPPMLQDFVAHCLLKDPAERWSCRQLLQHPFLAVMGPSRVQKQTLSRMLENSEQH